MTGLIGYLLIDFQTLIKSNLLIIVGYMKLVFHARKRRSVIASIFYLR